MFQVSVLASGSKGNSLLVRSDNSAIILDAGISAKRIFAALESFSIDREMVQAILISHEHSDHCGSAGALSRMLKRPIYITRDTYSYSVHKLGNLYDRIEFFRSGDEFRIGEIICEPFKSSHDAIDSCNFIFTSPAYAGKKLGVATDLGYPMKLTEFKLNSSTTLVLESNHDEQMLKDGPYEPHLKQRVKSQKGHLSNKQAVGLISQIYHAGLQNLVLAHLSEINNHPHLAQRTMQEYLDSIRSEVSLYVASPSEPTPLINI
ncbi:MAG: MBL fold metallo-hydrolase [Candidatus Cloacimonadota bacterium]